MPDINAGTPYRFEEAGDLKIYNVAGSTAYSVLDLQPGSLVVTPGLIATSAIMDRGRYTGVVLAGDARMSRIDFTARLKKSGLTTATDLLALLKPAASAGALQLFDVEWDYPDGRGATAGTRGTLQNCFLQDPERYQHSGPGADPDLIAVSLMSLDHEITWATYS